MLDHNTRQLAEHVRKFRTAVTALRELPRQLENHERTIRENPDLTPDEIKRDIRKTQQEHRARFQQLNTEATRHEEAGNQLVQQIRVNRQVDPTARTRVRELLDQGYAPSQVLDQATKLQSSAMVEALQTEMLWFGDGRQFAQSDETVRACDHALAQFGVGNQQEAHRNAVQLAQIAEPLPEIREFGAKHVTETGDRTKLHHDRLRLAFATSQQDKGDD